MSKGEKSEMLKLNKLYLLIGWIVSCFLFFEVAAHADEWNDETKLTFSQPIQIPGHVLPAGTYVFKLADTNDRHVVQIFNADGTQLLATAMAVATSRPEPTGATMITLAQPPQGGPEALLKWFYPGALTGNEFIYPKRQELQLAQGRHQDIAAKQPAESGD